MENAGDLTIEQLVQIQGKLNEETAKFITKELLESVD